MHEDRRGEGILHLAGFQKIEHGDGIEFGRGNNEQQLLQDTDEARPTARATARGLSVA